MRTVLTCFLACLFACLSCDSGQLSTGDNPPAGRVHPVTLAEKFAIIDGAVAYRRFWFGGPLRIDHCAVVQMLDNRASSLEGLSDATREAVTPAVELPCDRGSSRKTFERVLVVDSVLQTDSTLVLKATVFAGSNMRSEYFAFARPPLGLKEHRVTGMVSFTEPVTAPPRP